MANGFAEGLAGFAKGFASTYAMKQRQDAIAAQLGFEREKHEADVGFRREDLDMRRDLIEMQKNAARLKAEQEQNAAKLQSLEKLQAFGGELAGTTSPAQFKAVWNKQALAMGLDPKDPQVQAQREVITSMVPAQRDSLLKSFQVLTGVDPVQSEALYTAFVGGKVSYDKVFEMAQSIQTQKRLQGASPDQQLDVAGELAVTQPQQSTALTGVATARREASREQRRQDILSGDEASAGGQPGGQPSSFSQRVIQAESGGRADARNPRSSATGAGQFINDTWIRMIKTHRPDLAQGKSDRELLAMRTDPQLSAEMVDAYGQENAAYLSKRGLPTDPGSLYLAHFAGPQGAAKILSADPNESASSVLGRAATRANPFLKKFTAGGLRKWAARKVDAESAPQGAGEPSDGTIRTLFAGPGRAGPTIERAETLESVFGQPAQQAQPAAPEALFGRVELDGDLDDFDDEFDDGMSLDAQPGAQPAQGADRPRPVNTETIYPDRAEAPRQAAPRRPAVAGRPLQSDPADAYRRSLELAQRFRESGDTQTAQRFERKAQAMPEYHEARAERLQQTAQQLRSEGFNQDAEGFLKQAESSLKQANDIRERLQSAEGIKIVKNQAYGSIKQINEVISGATPQEWTWGMGQFTGNEDVTLWEDPVSYLIGNMNRGGAAGAEAIFGPLREHRNTASLRQELAVAGADLVMTYRAIQKQRGVTDSQQSNADLQFLQSIVGRLAQTNSREQAHRILDTQVRPVFERLLGSPIEKLKPIRKFKADRTRTMQRGFRDNFTAIPDPFDPNVDRQIEQMERGLQMLKEWKREQESLPPQ